MEDLITKKDLIQFRAQLLNDIQNIIKSNQLLEPPLQKMEWLRSKTVRQIMNISPGTLQNLRVSEKIRYRKVMGSYYYNYNDLLQLFKEEK